MNYYKVQAQSLLQRMSVTMRNPLTPSNYGLLHNTLAALLARFELADKDVEVVGFPGDEPSNLPGATYSSQTLASSTYSAFTGTQVVDVPTIAQALDYARAEGASEAAHEHEADCVRAYENGARDARSVDAIGAMSNNATESDLHVARALLNDESDLLLTGYVGYRRTRTAFETDVEALAQFRADARAEGCSARAGSWLVGFEDGVRAAARAARGLLK